MKSKKAFWLSSSFVICLVLVVVVGSITTPQEYKQNANFYLPFPADQTVLLGDLFVMKRDFILIWTSSESGPAKPYFIFFNTCINIPFKLTSIHNSSVSQTDVIVCNIWGGIYYRVPIIS